MSTISTEERREVARRLRELGKVVYDPENTYELLADALGVDDFEGTDELFNRLADLIEPTDGFDLDTVQRVCFECMEGCDEPEWTLYTTVYEAIARYKRGESGPTYDRDALLALADEMTWCYEGAASAEGDGTVGAWVVMQYAERIREALGVEHG